MMIDFYEMGTPWQNVLLVFSLLTVITLTGDCIIAFRYRCGVLKRFGGGVVLLLLNAVLYVVMQLDSRITPNEKKIHLQVSYVVLFLVTLLSMGYAVWSILQETKNRKTINNTSIKEAFDNLPTGVCFFNEAGLPVLCNRAMHRFSFAVCGKDVQYITDLKECLSQDFMPREGTIKDGKTFILPEGTAWHLEKHDFIHESADTYIQYIALDVTDLQRKRVELTIENAQLRKVQSDLKRLSANVVTITREEEILNTKMRVHDEMGRCLMAAQKYLKEDSTESIPDNVVTSWQRAVSMLKYNNETTDEDMLSQIRKTCQFVKLDYIQTGKLPKEEGMAYILTCAVRECVTNAVRYGEASELYADFTETETFATVTVTNNGKNPKDEIMEGGGLSTLRRRVERTGGTMSVESLPKFKLTVTVPKEKEGILL